MNVSHVVRKVYHGVRKVYHGVSKVYHGVRKVYHGVRKVYGLLPFLLLPLTFFVANTNLSNLIFLA